MPSWGSHFGIQIQIGPVILQDIQNGKIFPEGIGKAFRTHKGEVISGCMILGIAPVGRSHETADRQVETGRAVLPLIVTVWGKIHDFIILTGMLQDMGDCPIYVRVSPAALLVGGFSRITHAGRHQTVLYFVDPFFIQAEPCNGTDRSGNKKKSVGIAPWTCTQMFGQKSYHRHAGEVVVTERGMAGVTGDQDLVFLLSGEIILSIGEVAWFQGTVDADLIAVILHFQKIVMTQAESPGFLVIGGTVGNPVRMLRKGKEMVFQFRQRQGRPDGHAVTDHMQVRFPEINHPLDRRCFLHRRP